MQRNASLTESREIVENFNQWPEIGNPSMPAVFCIQSASQNNVRKSFSVVESLKQSNQPAQRVSLIPHRIPVNIIVNAARYSRFYLFLKLSKYLRAGIETLRR